MTLRLVADMSWQLQANCLGVHPDLFFPDRGASARQAKAVCKGCAVREQCLEYALDNGENYGVWGGTTERDRRRIRRARADAGQRKIRLRGRSTDLTAIQEQ